MNFLTVFLVTIIWIFNIFAGFERRIIIDCRGNVLGRLADIVANQLIEEKQIKDMQMKKLITILIGFISFNGEVNGASMDQKTLRKMEIWEKRVSFLERIIMCREEEIKGLSEDLKNNPQLLQSIPRLPQIIINPNLDLIDNLRLLRRLMVSPQFSPERAIMIEKHKMFSEQCHKNIVQRRKERKLQFKQKNIYVQRQLKNQKNIKEKPYNKLPRSQKRIQQAHRSKR